MISSSTRIPSSLPFTPGLERDHAPKMMRLSQIPPPFHDRTTPTFTFGPRTNGPPSNRSERTHQIPRTRLDLEEERGVHKVTTFPCSLSKKPTDDLSAVRRQRTFENLQGQSGRTCYQEAWHRKRGAKHQGRSTTSTSAKWKPGGPSCGTAVIIGRHITSQRKITPNGMAAARPTKRKRRLQLRRSARLRLGTTTLAITRPTLTRRPT